MNTFKLPDLGEGLDEAEIIRWHVKVGDRVSVDDPMLALETAKTVVEVPCPVSGIIKATYGRPGDRIATGALLVEFEGEPTPHSGTVYSQMPVSNADFFEEHIYGADSFADTRAAAMQAVLAGVGAQSTVPTPGDVTGSTLFDDADLHEWRVGEDLNARVPRAIATACSLEPALDASSVTVMIVEGRYATPVIIPPALATLGVGRLSREVVATQDGKIEVHQKMPLSLTFDHRCLASGAAARFLAAVIRDLQKGN